MTTFWAVDPMEKKGHLPLLAGTSGGFTLIELVMIIVLLSILSIAVTVKWPSGMKEKAAVYELVRAVRFAQHVAMTRSYEAGSPWGIEASGDTYSIRKFKGEMAEDPSGEGYPKTLLGDVSLHSPQSVWFNRFGEPVASDGSPVVALSIFSLTGGNQVRVYPETGYAE